MHPRTYAFTRRWWGQLGKPFRERVELLVEQERPREGYAAVLLSPYKEGPRERQVWVSDSIPEWSVRIVAGSRG